MLYALSRNSAEIVQGLSDTAEHVSHQTLLVQKLGETLTPLNARIGAVIRVGSRNVGAGSSCVGIAWYRDSTIPGLTRATRCNAVLSKTEGNTPEVVGKVDVIVLEAELVPSGGFGATPVHQKLVPVGQNVAKLDGFNGASVRSIWPAWRAFNSPVSSPKIWY